MMFLSVSPFGAFALFCSFSQRSKSDVRGWKAAEVSENGMTCETPYIFEAHSDTKMLSKLNQNESCIDLI